MEKHFYLWVNVETSLLSGQWKVPSLVALRMFNVWWPLEGKKEASFSPPSSFHPIDFKVLFYLILEHYFASILLFSWPINCTHMYWCTMFSTHSSPSWFWSNIFSFLEFMALLMTMSYKPQTSQMNEESFQELSLYFTLTQHLHDEDPKPWEVHLCFKVKPPQAWYNRIFQIFIFWWFCWKSTLLMLMNSKLSMKFFMKSQFLHGLQFLALDTIVDYASSITS